MQADALKGLGQLLYPEGCDANQRLPPPAYTQEALLQNRPMAVIGCALPVAGGAEGQVTGNANLCAALQAKRRCDWRT